MEPAHGGDAVVGAVRRFGVETMFTLSGGHVFPLYDGAVRAGNHPRIVDVRHEQTAVFAAEATARLTRRPGLAVLTAGPGVTNGVSGITTAHFNGSPVVVLAGRAPRGRWGSGALQELDHPPLVAPVTKLAATSAGPEALVPDVVRAFAEEFGLPVVANGQARGVLPAGHGLLVTRARGPAFERADLVIVAGAPLDFRLKYGAFAGGRADVVHLADSPEQLATHVAATGAAGDLTEVFTRLAAACGKAGASPAAHAAWADELRDTARAAIAGDAALPASDADPIHPLRVYGELARLLADDAVVIGDGGDFVSYAGKHLEPRRPGCWLDPGPYGCLGTGLGYAAAARLARPSAQVVLLLGDGAAGFSLMDADTLVRHGLPVVMIVGNNGIWGLEKHPMRGLYGYDVAADLQPHCRYDEVVRALGGAGEQVVRPGQIGPALRRAFDSGVPYLVNVSTDPADAYPRSTTGV
ncbi:thiamine pyrophosphate-binding protein [Spirillospora sp. CA-253888]